MCARHGRGNRNLFVRKGGASQKKIGKHWSNGVSKLSTVQMANVKSPEKAQTVRSASQQDRTNTDCSFSH